MTGIQPIVGTVDSQVLNDNLSYLEALLLSVNGSPKGVKNTLADLQAAFPTGTTGIYVVISDSKWYYWNGSTWAPGTTYLSSGIPKIIPLLNSSPSGNPSIICGTDTFTINDTNALILVNTIYLSLAAAVYSSLTNNGDLLIIDRTTPLTSNISGVNLQKISYIALLNSDIIVAWKDVNGVHTIFDAALNNKKINDVDAGIISKIKANDRKIAGVINSTAGNELSVGSDSFSINTANVVLVIINNVYHTLNVQSFTGILNTYFIIIDRTVDLTITHGSGTGVNLQLVNYNTLLPTDVIVAYRDYNGVHTIFDNILQDRKINSITPAKRTNGILFSTAGNEMTITTNSFTVNTAAVALVVTGSSYQSLNTQSFTGLSNADFLILDRTLDLSTTHANVSLQKVAYTALLPTDIVVAYCDLNGVHTIFDNILQDRKIATNSSLKRTTPIINSTAGTEISIGFDTFSINTAGVVMVLTGNTYQTLSIQSFTGILNTYFLILDRTLDLTVNHSTGVNLQLVNYNALLPTDIVVAYRDFNGMHTIFDNILQDRKIAANVASIAANASSIALQNGYFNKQAMQIQLGNFLYKLRNGQTINVLIIGDSIANFQNSGQLDSTAQKTAPVGLAGENWARRLWKALNYNVWNDKRDTIVNVNGNMGFKRYDHADFSFSNGYSGTTSLGTSDWGANRNDSEAWRDNDFNGSLGTTPDRQLTPDSTYNIPMVGTVKSGATANVIVPSNAIGCRVILGKNKQTSASAAATIAISDGQNQAIDPSTFTTYQNYFDFVLTPGTSKVLTITNNASGELWIWGIEYWTGPYVRVMNFGLAGNSSADINSKWSKIPKANIDLVVFETPALNDVNALTYLESLSNADTLMNNIKALNVPILPILVHRTNVNGSMKYDRNTATIGTRYFMPIYIKGYKSIFAKNGLIYIDMWQKSINDVGGSLADSVVFPAGYFVDWGHPGTVLNQSILDELNKAVLWSDIG